MRSTTLGLSRSRLRLDYSRTATFWNTSARKTRRTAFIWGNEVTIPRVVLALSVMSASLAAQWLNHPDPQTPRQYDGKPNLSAPAPRLNGKVDLTGLWEADATPMRELK